MKNNIRIITDSGSDLPQNPHPQITVLPMTIRFGEEEYRDGVDLTPREFYEKLVETDQLPTTSLVSPLAFEGACRKAEEAGEEVVIVTISGELSGTYQSACIGAEEVKNAYAVDSRTVAIGQQILVWRGLQLAEEGKSAKEIAAILTEEREELHVLAVLNTLEYLKKGGRISPAAAFVGGALSIKPVVTTKEGKVAVIGKARGSKNGNNYLMKEIEATSGIDFDRPLRLGYTGLGDELLQKYIQDSREAWVGHEEALVVSPIGPTIGTHVGPGAIAVAFFAKKSEN